MNLGAGELIVILVIVLLVVGGRRLPEIGQALGKSIREFQDALRARPGEKDRRAGGKSGNDKHKE